MARENSAYRRSDPKRSQGAKTASQARRQARKLKYAH